MPMTTEELAEELAMRERNERQRRGLPEHRPQAHPDDRRTGVINAGMFSLEHLELIADALNFEARASNDHQRKAECDKLAERFAGLANMLK